MERNNNIQVNNNNIEFMSGDEVETDGVYANESGREVTLRRGDQFPSDLVLGKTTWTQKGFSLNESTIDHKQREDTSARAQRQGGSGAGRGD